MSEGSAVGMSCTGIMGALAAAGGVAGSEEQVFSIVIHRAGEPIHNRDAVLM